MLNIVIQMQKVKLNNLLVKRAFLKEELKYYYNKNLNGNSMVKSGFMQHSTLNNKNWYFLKKKYVCSSCEDTKKVITTAMLGRYEEKVNGRCWG